VTADRHLRPGERVRAAAATCPAPLVLLLQRTTLRIHITLTVIGFGGFLSLVGIIGSQPTIGLSAFGGGLAFVAAFLLPFLTLGEPVWVARRASARR
jgi:hypothetical protein